MTQRVLESPHVFVQMEAHFSLIKMLSWKGRQNTSIPCSIAHKLSVTMRSTNCHRQSVMFCLMNFQTSRKQGKRFNNCLLTDAIPGEVYKAGGLPMTEKLTELFQCMWMKEAIPKEFKDTSVIHLYKRKENPQVYDTHRDISHLSIARKILAYILYNRLNVHLDQADFYKVNGFKTTKEQNK